MRWLGCILISSTGILGQAALAANIFAKTPSGRYDLSIAHSVLGDGVVCSCHGPATSAATATRQSLRQAPARDCIRVSGRDWQYRFPCVPDGWIADRLVSVWSADRASPDYSVASQRRGYARLGGRHGRRRSRHFHHMVLQDDPTHSAQPAWAFFKAAKIAALSSNFSCKCKGRGRPPRFDCGPR